MPCVRVVQAWRGSPWALLGLRAVPKKESAAVMGKHPDFMVAHPTSTIFRPLVEIFEISYFFAKNFEKV
jgi:hypothetical protein